MSLSRDEVDRSVLRLHRILDAAKLLNSTLDLQELTATILRIVRDEVDVDRGTVFTLDRAQGQLRSLVAQDVTGRELIVPLGRGICGLVGATGQAIHIPDAYADPRFDPTVDAELDYRTNDIYCLPIVNREGAVVGVLELLNADRRLTTEDEAFLNGVSVHMGLALENARMHCEIVEKRKMERELSLARDIQRSLCPVFPARVHGIEVAAACEMCGAVGGDYLDYFLLEDDRFLLALGDVSGKGIGAALVMSSVHATCRALVRHVHGIERIAAIVNDTLVTSTHDGMFITLLFALVDPVARRLHCLNAGHHAPIAATRDGRVTLLSGASGPPAGLFADIHYERDVTDIEPGSVILLYTDGIVEAENTRGEEFGIERLMTLVGSLRDQSAPAIRAGIHDAIRQFAGGAPARDDATFIVLRAPDGMS